MCCHPKADMAGDPVGLDPDGHVNLMVLYKGVGRAGENGGVNHLRPQAALRAHVHRCPSHPLIPKWPHIDKY